MLIVRRSPTLLNSLSVQEMSDGCLDTIVAIREFFDILRVVIKCARFVVAVDLVTFAYLAVTGSAQLVASYALGGILCLRLIGYYCLTNCWWDGWESCCNVIQGSARTSLAAVYVRKG